MRITKTLALATVTLVAAGVLGACGGDDGGDKWGDGGKSDDGDVSSLKSGSPSSGSDGSGSGSGSSDGAGSASRKALDAKRPHLRMDTSQDEIDRLGNAYNACLQSHGVPMNHKRAEAAGAEQAAPLQSYQGEKKYKAAYDACLVKLPLQPPELRPETNPHFADDYRAYVKCLNKKGLRVHMTRDDDGTPNGWTYDDSNASSLSEAEQTKADDVCKTGAFRAKKR